MLASGAGACRDQNKLHRVFRTFFFSSKTIGTEKTETRLRRPTMPALPVLRIKLLSGGRRVVSPPEDAENPLGAQRRPLTCEISWIRVVRKLNNSTMKDDPAAPMLSEDELRLLASLLCCPLQPQVAVAWFSTCHAVHSASAEVVATLKAQHLAIGRLRDKLNRASQTSQFQSASWGSGSVNGALLVPSVASFRDVDRAHWTGSGLTATDCEAVGTSNPNPSH